MAIVVTLFGILVAGVALFVLFAPARFLGWMASLDRRALFGIGVTIRIAMGVAFLYAAPSCRLPVVAQVVGILALIAAAGLLVMGPSRLESLVEWWLKQSPAFVRGWGVVALGLGCLLVYAGA